MYIVTSVELIFSISLLISSVKIWNWKISLLAPVSPTSNKNKFTLWQWLRMSPTWKSVPGWDILNHRIFHPILLTCHSLTTSHSSSIALLPPFMLSILELEFTHSFLTIIHVFCLIVCQIMNPFPLFLPVSMFQ